MLPAQYRMTRSTDFGLTVHRGVRAVQSDLVVHSLRSAVVHEGGVPEMAPKIGLVVSKSVGNAVVRHQVARRLRGVARGVIEDLEPGDRLVIRALPGSRDAISARLDQQLRAALRKARSEPGVRR